MPSGALPLRVEPRLGHHRSVASAKYNMVAAEAVVMADLVNEHKLQKNLNVPRQEVERRFSHRHVTAPNVNALLDQHVPCVPPQAEQGDGTPREANPASANGSAAQVPKSPPSDGKEENK